LRANLSGKRLFWFVEPINALADDESGNLTSDSSDFALKIPVLARITRNGSGDCPARALALAQPKRFSRAAARNDLKVQSPTYDRDWRLAFRVFLAEGLTYVGGVGPVRRSLAGFFEGLTSVGGVGKIAFARVETLYVRNLV
jgi:hypothetical protein